MDSMNLDREIISILCKITGIFKQLNDRYSVIGATAFLLHQVDLTRTTRDIDFSILIDGDWDDFEKMKQGFMRENFKSTKIPHRMKTEDGFIIDLLPVGDKIVRNESICWPDGVIMNANGLKEAVENVVLIDVEQCTVPVASLPILVMLKLFAYDDQKEPKHIYDILRSFIFYEKERRFDLLVEDIDNLTYENAGSLLMGRDLRTLISQKQAGLVKSIITAIEDEMSFEDEKMELITFFRYGLSQLL